MLTARLKRHGVKPPSMADTQGFADIAWRAHRGLRRLLVQGAAHAQAERDARRRLAGAAHGRPCSTAEASAAPPGLRQPRNRGWSAWH
jgi:hypothetical protein